MSRGARQEEQLECRLRRMLPLPAHGKPPLLAFLRNHAPIERGALRLTVTNVFRSGDGTGLMCQFVVSGAAETSHIYVAPITQIAFDRRHPISQELALYRKRRCERIDVNSHLSRGPQWRR
jgi:hypothetical protein